MNKIKILQVCFLIALFFCSVLTAQENNEQASLAILVYCDGGSQDLANKLQPLVEAEASLQWDGTLVERAQIDNLLDEMKLTRSGLSDPNNQLQLGKMITMDCLLTVRVNKDSVKATLSQFPSTTIIHEKEYTKRLEPQSLSVNIVTNAIKEYREHNRDPHKPQISIGSFFNTGPFKRYFDFSKNIGIQLREELVKDNSIVLTERLLPSDLLGEFELARAGITESIAKNLSAPPSDILLYGEFKAKPEQDLTKPAAELDFTLFVISPTGLCDKKQVEFSCYSNEPEVPVEKAKDLIEQVSNEARTHLSSGPKRSFSEKEFEAFKKQAFRLMPNPPKSDGDFNTKELPSSQGLTQIGTAEVLEQALNMLECTLLFKGNDTQVLVCTGAIFNGLSRFADDFYPDNELEKFNKFSLELIERAYLIESNWNTRFAYYSFFVSHDGSSDIMPEYLEAAKYIWDTRETENWNESQVLYSLELLLKAETDTQKLCNLFLEAVLKPKEPINNTKTISLYLEAIKSHITKNKQNPQTTKYLIQFSQSLINEKKLHHRRLGYFLYVLTYTYNRSLAYNPAHGEETVIPIEFVEYFRTLLKIQEELRASQNAEFNGFFIIYDEVLKQYNLENDSVDLMEKYILDLTRSGKNRSFELTGMLNFLITELWENGEYERGYYILTEFLQENNIFSDEHFIQQRTRFFNAMQEESNSDDNLFVKIEFDDDSLDYVLNVISSKNTIYGIISQTNGLNGKFFTLTSGQKKAHIINEISGDVLDIAIAGKYVGIATKYNGFYLLNTKNKKIKHFTTENSSFPGNRANQIFASDNNFIIEVRDNKANSESYILDPENTTINLLDSNTPFERLEYETEKPEPILSRKISSEGIKYFVISNSEGKQLFTCDETLLSNINDYKLWKETLFIAADEFLYVSDVGSNTLRYLPNKNNVIFYCLCPLGNELYIGTSNGLYYIRAEQFLKIVKEVEQREQ